MIHPYATTVSVFWLFSDASTIVRANVRFPPIWKRSALPSGGILKTHSIYIHGRYNSSIGPAAEYLSSFHRVKIKAADPSTRNVCVFITSAGAEFSVAAHFVHWANFALNAPGQKVAFLICSLWRSASYAIIAFAGNTSVLFSRGVRVTPTCS